MEIWKSATKITGTDQSKCQYSAEIKENRIKLRIKAAAVNGKANDAIIKFFSKEFRVPKSSVEILRGGKSTKKLVSIHSPGQLPELPGLQRNGLK